MMPRATETNVTMSGENTEDVTHRDVGSSIKIKSKRGTSTNDRDEVQLETHAETISELGEDADRARKIVARILKAQRKVQPDEDSE